MNRPIVTCYKLMTLSLALNRIVKRRQYGPKEAILTKKIRIYGTEELKHLFFSNQVLNPKILTDGLL